MSTINIDTSLTDEQILVLRQLREKGFAVCVFKPEEMAYSEPCDVEDAMCEGGWRQINFDTPSGLPISG